MAQAISFSRPPLFSRGFYFFCTPVRRCSIMAAQRVVDGRCVWIQIVRGPRPRSEQWPRAGATRSPVPSSVQVAQPQKPTFKAAKDKVKPRRSPGCSAEQDLQVGEGSRSGERLHWPIGRCSFVRVGQGAPPLNVQISTQEFIWRSERRLIDLEVERTAESK